MKEQSKSAERRKLDPRFVQRWIRGKVIDIGCGDDPLSKEDWPEVQEVVPYDQELGSGNAQFMSDVSNGEFDCVHSSHCLEHLHNTRGALTNWLRILKPGGFIVCTIPEEFLYEQGKWPSRYNPDHKVSFTMRSMPMIPTSANILGILWKLPVDVEYVSLQTMGWDPSKFGQDQTQTGAECSIEFVARKPDNKRPW